jgi:superoxide dismutase, Cu-Zn family
MKALLVLLGSCVAIAACNRAQSPPPPTDAANAPPPTSLPEPTPITTPETALVVLAGTKDSPVRGELRLTVAEGGVKVAGEIAGLTPGTEHGFHVHEHGDCSAPDASSAGEHFNPDNAPHGGPTANPRHLGDLPNVKADAAGRATVDATLGGATLRIAGPNNLVGKAFIVHAGRDDYKTQPSGDSGDRVACGVVQ